MQPSMQQQQQQQEMALKQVTVRIHFLEGQSEFLTAWVGQFRAATQPDPTRSSAEALMIDWQLAKLERELLIVTQELDGLKAGMEQFNNRSGLVIPRQGMKNPTKN